MTDLFTDLRARHRSRVRRRAAAVLGLLAGSWLLVLGIGQYPVAPWDVLIALVGEAEREAELVVTEFRLPRSVLAVVVGAAFALSGGVLQGAARNGLADPGVLGIGAGAGLGVMVVYAFAGEAVPLTPWTLPIVAFLGGSLAAVLVWALATRGGQIQPYRLILVGIAVGLGLGAVTLLIAVSVDPEVFRAAARFQAGSLAGRGWTSVLAVAPWLLVAIPLILLRSTALDLLSIGDDVATGLGLAAERQRRIVVAAAVAAACAAAAVGGAIAFAGLIAPHIARRLVGPVHRNMLPVAALVGALLVLVADLLGRTVFAPGEIPAGIVTGILGAPYFLYLLARTRG